MKDRIRDRMTAAVKPLPKWVMLSYAKLWREFGDRQFEHSGAADILGTDLTSVVIFHLRRNGWAGAALSPADSRKRLYVLKRPDEAMEAMSREKK